MSNSNIYTTSALMKYMTYTTGFTLDDVADLLGVTIGDVREYEQGRRVLTKSHYFKIIEVMPELEGKVEYFENMKLRDKDRYMRDVEQLDESNMYEYVRALENEVKKLKQEIAGLQADIALNDLYNKGKSKEDLAYEFGLEE